MAVGEAWNNPAQLQIFLGNGDGSFQPPITYDRGQDGFDGMAVADLRGDGKLDIVGLCNAGVEVFLSNGDGTFQAPTVIPVSGDVSLALGDVNGDGHPDIVLGGNYQSNYIQVLLGNGDGTFQSPITSTFSNYRSPQGYTDLPTSIALGDLNGDGKLDVVAASSADQQVWVLPGNGDGTFQAPTVFESDPIPRADVESPIIAEPAQPDGRRRF